MPRTIINLSDTDKEWLDRHSRRRRVSMTSLVSEAVEQYRLREESRGQPDLQSALRDTSGLWRQGDGLSWQHRLRDEWGERG